MSPVACAGWEETGPADNDVEDEAAEFDADAITVDGATIHRIISEATGKVVAVGGDQAGAPIRQETNRNNRMQRWKLRAAGGEVEIVNAATGKCLDVPGFDQSNGVRLQQWDCSGQSNQRWRVEPVGQNFRIVSALSGKCLDVPGGDSTEGLVLQQYDCWSSPFQRFSIRTPAGGSGGNGSSGPTTAAGSLKDAARGAGKKMGVALSASGLNDPSYTALIAKEYDYVTPENEMKWDATEPRPGEFSFGGADAIVRFASDHGMAVKGHTLVWHSQLPGWVSDLSSAQQVRDAMVRHIQGVAGHFRGKVRAWDVVNEAIDDGNGNQLRRSVFFSKLGETFIDEAFRAAKEADPGALLFYNDYGIEGIGGKSDAAYNLVKRLVERRVPINGVGLQMHIGAVGWPSADDVARQIQRFTDLGLSVNISEIDVQVCNVGGSAEEKLQAQKARYHDIVAACRRNAKCEAVTTWGAVDRLSWLNDFDLVAHAGVCNNGSGAPRPLPFDDGLQRKPAWQGIVDALSGR